MAVPANVTASITALQALPQIAYPANPTTEAYQLIRAQMLATGTYPGDSGTTIRQAILASQTVSIEREIRKALLAEFQRIQAAG